MQTASQTILMPNIELIDTVVANREQQTRSPSPWRRNTHSDAPIIKARCRSVVHNVLIIFAMSIYKIHDDTYGTANRRAMWDLIRFVLLAIDSCSELRKCATPIPLPLPQHCSTIFLII